MKASVWGGGWQPGSARRPSGVRGFSKFSQSDILDVVCVLERYDTSVARGAPLPLPGYIWRRMQKRSAESCKVSESPLDRQQGTGGREGLAPEVPKSSTMPHQHGLGLDQQHGLTPAGN